MTARVPDLLDSVLAAFPGELAVRKRGNGLVLEIRSPTLAGSLFATHRADIQEIAVAYERMRHGQMYGPRRCTCGALYGQHLWDADGKRNSACPEGGGRYQPQDVAVTAGQENSNA